MATLVKVFIGEYDIVHRFSLKAEFDALRAESRTTILDMSAVTYLDSSFARELIRFHKMRAEQGFNRLTIVRVAPIVKRVFRLLYMGTFYRMVDTLEEALPKDGKSVVVQQACSGGPSMCQERHPSTSRNDPAWIARVLTVAGV